MHPDAVRNLGKSYRHHYQPTIQDNFKLEVADIANTLWILDGDEYRALLVIKVAFDCSLAQAWVKITIWSTVGKVDKSFGEYASNALKTMNFDRHGNSIGSR